MYLFVISHIKGFVFHHVVSTVSGTGLEVAQLISHRFPSHTEGECQVRPFQFCRISSSVCVQLSLPAEFSRIGRTPDRRVTSGSSGHLGLT